MLSKSENAYQNKNESVSGGVNAVHYHLTSRGHYYAELWQRVAAPT